MCAGSVGGTEDVALASIPEGVGGHRPPHSATSQWQLKQLSWGVVILNVSQPGTVAAPTPPKHEGPQSGVLASQGQWGQHSRRQVPDSDIGAVLARRWGEAPGTSLRRARPSAPPQGARPRR